MEKTHRAGGMGRFLRFAEKSRDFLKILRNRPRTRGVAYFTLPRHVWRVFSEFREIRVNGANPPLGGLDQFLRFAGKSRDFLKIICDRPRISGVAYPAPPRHVGPVSPIPTDPEKSE